ncbi:MAG TPA: electron transfer flavoprotein subunit alpha/FixB family protein, partial [Candidatus Poseidoniales archaeon]|nr:electron transfer flavoprotein subunit alpha/FixB family protein [Candidatus Poseidoniales archaeon]
MTFTIIAESAGDSLHPTTAQLVGAASSLGNGSTVICPGGIGAAEAATIAGVEKVISVVGDCFSTFDGGAWASAINSVCNGVILASASPIGREVAARIAAKRGIPIVQDATDLADGIAITRPIYSGKAVETSTVTGDCVITLRPNAFDAAEGGASAPVNVVDQSADVTIAVMEAIAKASERLDVAEADIIISGGRGIGSIENFRHLEEVADIIGAAVGASRAVVDEW